MKKETYVYASLKERIASEYKVFAVAFIFVIIADAIGQVKIPLGPGMLILFPIFYAIIPVSYTHLKKVNSSGVKIVILRKM